FSRQVVGWSMQSRMQADLVLKALVMAVWKRKPEPGLLVHSDQGSQYTGHEWQKFIDDHCQHQPEMSCFQRSEMSPFQVNWTGTT
ncbi:transposase family protein, partial [Wenzhouxiangella sp. XN79A]|nr:transposase family protein [Wenzhouxiangella sp. XN79A]